MLEANKFWLYSLVCSILWGLLQLFAQAAAAPKENAEKATLDKVGREEGGGSAGPKNLEGVKRRIVSDCFDLLIPGHVTGWITTSTATVGFASIVSTTLSSKDIWNRLKE